MVVCQQCKLELGDIDTGAPCPNCGSTNRDHVLKAEPGVFTISGTAATLTVTRLWTKLLRSAETFHIAGDYGMAVVVAQTACEIIFERAITQALEAKNQPGLSEIIVSLVEKTCSPENDRARSLVYDPLMNDELGKTPFWSDYKTLVKFRNDSVHRAKSPSESESRKGLDTAAKLVAHIVQQAGLS